MKKPTSLVIASLASLVAARAASVAPAVSDGYLFATFRGEQTPMSEQIYFALSQDGRTWTALNQGEPVLVSGLGEKGARDPYLLRSHDGSRFYLIATDLSINLNRDWGRAVRAGSRSILVWESRDLVNWSAPRLVKVAPDDAGCTWAPEATYDAKSGDYLVYWASTTGRDQFARQRIWAARTKDFRSFGDPFVYIERDSHIIDTTIVREGDAYYRFSKDETHKAVALETSESLMGPWTLMEGFSLAKLQGYEGPECYRIGKGGWCLILDHYTAGAGYQPYVTDDLAGGRFTPAEGFSFPFRFRHGSVLPLSEAEYGRLSAALVIGVNEEAFLAAAAPSGSPASRRPGKSWAGSAR